MLRDVSSGFPHRDGRAERLAPSGLNRLAFVLLPVCCHIRRKPESE